MQAHRIETVIQPNSSIILENLPFEPGQIVEVTILETQPKQNKTENLYPLHGTRYKYDDPFEPAMLLEDRETLG